MPPKIKLSKNPHPSSVDAFLMHQQSQSLLRFITCGSVDDGKSTLIGRLLWESKNITYEQLTTLKRDSKKQGTQDGKIDFALLVDGLGAEKTQGITIDVAYRFFSTQNRKFIAADTPGHEEYTCNMVTGASTADAAVILVDAQFGLQIQTRRHAYLLSLMGIRQVILAVNKMDLVNFDQGTFQRSVDTFLQFSQTLGFENIVPIALSALKGDNITQRSAHMPWYTGPTLIGCLETLSVAQPESDRLVFPVQWVNRPDALFRGYSGYVDEGRIRVGDEIRVVASGQTATIAEIVSMDGPKQEALSGEATTLTLSKDIDISRGDIISLNQYPLEVTDQFEATLVWMDQEAGLHGRSYNIKLATQWASASITNIKYKIDINTLTRDASTKLALNDISVCTLAVSKPLVYDTYQNSKTLGSFILIDRMSNATVAGGMINHSLRRAQNVHKQALSITREKRETLNGHEGKVIWLTGLSGSGKSTLANALEVELHEQGYRTYVLDGDNLRQGLNKDLGFTDADRVENIRRVAEVAKLMMDAGLIVITAFISPFRRERQMARELIGDAHFTEVYISTPLKTCEERDVKGLYKKARSGQLPNLSGIGSPYEPPENSCPTINTTNQDLGTSVKALLDISVDIKRPSGSI
ncbi:sulfate adenylyltransferase subunit CysN [Pseudomonas reactans]